MAKTPTTVEDVEEITSDEEEVDETEDDESIVTPKMLAEELEISPKALRAFLRRKFARPAGEKNTSWNLTEAQVEAARTNWAEDPESDEDDEDGDESDED